MIRFNEQSFEANGVLQMDSYLRAPWIEELISGAKCTPPATLMSSEPNSGIRIKRGVRFAQRNLLSNEIVRRFIKSDPVELLIDWLGPGLIAVRALLFDKTGDANWTVPWHQDRSIAVKEKTNSDGFGPWSVKAGVVHVQPPVELLRQMITLRFSLDQCDEDNGPLRVIAGTHQRILNQIEIEQAVKDRPESHCTTSAGGVVIMRPLLLHASSPAKMASHRRVLHIEFGPQTLPGGLEWARV